MNLNPFLRDDISPDMLRLRDTAYSLLEKYGLHDWQFEMMRTARTIGRCKHDSKIIEFSEYFLNMPYYDQLDTLRHEIAHALCGPKVGHSDVWKRKAIELGARPEACAPFLPTKPPTWLGVCNGCGSQFAFYREVKRGKACPQCRVHLVFYSEKNFDKIPEFGQTPIAPPPDYRYD